MDLTAKLTHVVFKNDLEIEIKKDEILVIVGPNNSGKSSFITDVVNHCSNNGEFGIVTKDIKTKTESTVDDVIELLRDKKRADGSYQVFRNITNDYQINQVFGPNQERFGQVFTPLFILNLSTRSRLRDCDPPENIDMAQREPDHPFQHMYRDDNLEACAQEEFRKAFKEDLVVHRGGGSKIRVFVGARPTMESGEDRVSRSWLDKVEQMKPIEKQGDGVRSYVSILSRILTEGRSIQLIDEPEAFLHPPQAKLIAEVITNKSTAAQVLIATHSKDVLTGLLTKPDRVNVLRFSRPNGNFQAAHLKNQQIVDLWNNPILRFSNILDGLFHEGVIVSEGDGDCRFYEALMDCVRVRKSA